MALLMLDRDPVFKRKQKIMPTGGRSRPLPSYGYHPSQTTLSLHQTAPHHVSPLPSPRPANPGWAGSPGPYMHSQSMVPVSQQSLPVYNLPVRPSTATSPPRPWATTVNLAPPHPQPSPHAQGWSPSPPMGRPMHAASSSTTNLGDALQNRTNFYAHTASNSVTNLHNKTAGYLNQGAALCDRIASRLDAVITAIDGEVFSGNESELLIVQDPEPYGAAGSSSRAAGPLALRSDPTGPMTINSANLFSKVWLYANSRLPPMQPPLKVYINTYQLFCLAAQYSENVYNRPIGAERETHIDADWRQGTKAMLIKSAPIDELNTIVFAIRGSQTFMDWAVNFRPAPASPNGFLDDHGNLCHSGFLHVARKMIEPVAARLKSLLEQNPNRSNYSLLITGHSAGGAVAQLLYAHMYSNVKSPLSHLTNFFKRVHCITFGAPPVSLLALRRPSSPHSRKSLFYSLINEGDPVARADPIIVKSLLKLYAKSTPAPLSSPGKCVATIGNLVTATTAAALKPCKKLPTPKPHKSPKPPKQSKHSKHQPQPLPRWPVPETDMSCGGQLVLLRVKHGHNISKPPSRNGQDDIEAVVIRDQDLRHVIFGDPMCHMMTLYLRRVEQLAMKAVTAKGYE